MQYETRKAAFQKANEDLQDFLKSKGLSNIDIYLSNELPRANKVSGKFNHIYKDFL